MEPHYFAVSAANSICLLAWGLPNAVGDEIFGVTFSPKNLEIPTAEPIGVYFQDGSRKYIWRDKFWMEVDLPVASFLERIAKKLKVAVSPKEAMEYRDLMDFVKLYGKSVGPTDKDALDNPATAGKVFYRLLYEIPG